MLYYSLVDHCLLHSDDSVTDSNLIRKFIRAEPFDYILTLKFTFTIKAFSSIQINKPHGYPIMTSDILPYDCNVIVFGDGRDAGRVDLADYLSESNSRTF